MMKRWYFINVIACCRIDLELSAARQLNFKYWFKNTARIAHYRNNNRVKHLDIRKINNKTERILKIKKPFTRTSEKQRENNKKIKCKESSNYGTGARGLKWQCYGRPSNRTVKYRVGGKMKDGSTTRNVCEINAQFL